MNETPIDENVVESPVRPKDTKAAKRKGKGKAKSSAAEEYEKIKVDTCMRLDLMVYFNDLKQKEQMSDALGRKGLSPLQKCTAAIRMLAYEIGVDVVDDYVRIEWPTFVKTIPRPQGEKRKLFSKYQESRRKDVERAFGVLQSRFAILCGPARFWDRADLAKIMRACIILHNMIVEDERDTYATPFGPLPSYDDATNGLPPPNLGEEKLASYETYIQRNIQILDRQKHHQLQSDMVEHISSIHNSG
ncbi:uncharacterized protein LOC141664598 [Apium graveolens]|uniref:uncharacterized protein LOC141664598 n=1 Tax=Apium graveolens TaxID=4045 RepID=UPI003D7958B8